MADISKLEQQANLLMNCDEEVIKALECCSDGTDKGIIRATLDLINRQKAEIDILVRKHDTLLDEIAEKNAEIERLTEENKEVHSNWQKLKKSYDELSDEAKAEVERLSKEVDYWKEGAFKECMSRGQLVTTTKSEAIKEFAEEFEKRCIAKGIYPVIVKNTLKDLLKEKTEDKQ